MIDARVPVDRLLNRGQGLGVVGLRIDADPVLGEIDANNLVGHQGTADVGAEVTDPRNGSQFATGKNGRPVHFGMGRAGLGQPVHQKIALLE